MGIILEVEVLVNKDSGDRTEKPLEDTRNKV